MNVEGIFSEAARITDPLARRQYLDGACANDPELRARVEALLLARSKSGSFLETVAGPAPAVRHLLDEGSSPAPLPPIAERPGTLIGRYKLLQQIGEGGMGVVYMAEQEKPVRRRVALKIIKPGMDSAQVIARFEAERQALAMMDHPNIARVLDAGCTDAGRPYFVMELVQGVPITKYCDDKQLDTAARLDLFVQVCHAVQHAHQKGIIHRDIKPSNVLVMIYDSKPAPKIIDFGVAKALHQSLTEMTMFTQFGAVVGTLEYMSPEQAEMDALGTDTRSDIYSLGVLLYELLTGSTPLDGRMLRLLGYAEMLKTIREVDPPRPSTRLSQSRQDMGSISTHRHTEPRRLQKLIAGDLDWIVMKCLEKDRTRRYETANGLALDIQRHLHDEAVSACPPGKLYKLQKLVRRNKLAFGAIAAVMMALVLGLAASLWQAGRAAREAVRAQHEATRANTALNDLRAAAPSFAAEARGLAAQEKFDEAIGRLDYAVTLRPDVPDYLLAKGDLLETQMRLADAATVYRAALKLNPNDARVKENADLCEQLASAAKSADGKLTRETLSRLNTQMLKDQRPAAEIMPIARLVGDEKSHIVRYWLDRLKDIPNGTDKPLEKRLSVREDGLLKLDLSGTPVADLSPLAGMPLGELSLENCTKATDLAPLHGMRLTELSIAGAAVSSLDPLREMSTLQTLLVSGTEVSDLSPLSGLRLKRLEITGCQVTSLSPLRGMPLEKLDMPQTAIADLSPLVGMPLKLLDASGVPVTDFTPLAELPLESLCLQHNHVGDLGFLRAMPLKQLTLLGSQNIRNLAVLSDIRSLEIVALPDFAGFAFNDIDAIANLRNHPSLKQIATFVPTGLRLEKVPPKDEFWKHWDRDIAWVVRLRKAGIAFYFGRAQAGDGTWYLSCHDQPKLTDLSILSGAGISQLELINCKVSDLTPLKGMPLRYLKLSGNPVMDLSPLAGMKLSCIYLDHTQVQDISLLSDMPLAYVNLEGCALLTDLAPLAACKSLAMILLPSKATDLEPLRKLPKLDHISFGPGTHTDNEVIVDCPAEAFWKTWDGLPWARKLEAAGIPFIFEQSADGYYGVAVHAPRFTDCSIFNGSNVRRLNVEHSGVVDLSPLADQPLESLDIRETKLTDLSPLRSKVLNQSLREILLWKSAVTDFSPLAACAKLEAVDASDTALSDLSAVKGLRLKSLRIARTAVTDISPLAGMPLEQVHLGGTAVTDISPLLKCPTLQSLVLPQTADKIDSLHTLPNLARVSYQAKSGGDPDVTTAEFWSIRAAEEPWVAALRKARINYTRHRQADGSWQLILDEKPITDLSPIKGANISNLSIMRTPVSDLSPLRGMKLTSLWISGTKVTDLSPLNGMHITAMNVSGTDVSDLTPLIGMPLQTLLMSSCKRITDLSPLQGMADTLEDLTLPKTDADIEFLRKFPKIKRLSYRFDNATSGPSMTAQDFWAEYDKAKPLATATSQPAS